MESRSTKLVESHLKQSDMSLWLIVFSFLNGKILAFSLIFVVFVIFHLQKVRGCDGVHISRYSLSRHNTQSLLEALLLSLICLLEYVSRKNLSLMRIKGLIYKDIEIKAESETVKPQLFWHMLIVPTFWSKYVTWCLPSPSYVTSIKKYWLSSSQKTTIRSTQLSLTGEKLSPVALYVVFSRLCCISSRWTCMIRNRRLWSLPWEHLKFAEHGWKVFFPGPCEHP